MFTDLSVFSITTPGEDGRLCLTTYNREFTFRNAELGTFSLLKLQPHTGRKRQLRKHCHFHLGCTMVGEKLHQIDDAIKKGSEKQRELDQMSVKLMKKIAAKKHMMCETPLFLHATSVMLCHPLLHSGKPLVVKAPRPKMLDAAIEALRGSNDPSHQ